MDALRISCYLVRLKIPILQATISKKLMEIPCSHHAARNDVMATATAKTLFLLFPGPGEIRFNTGSNRFLEIVSLKNCNDRTVTTLCNPLLHSSDWKNVAPEIWFTFCSIM